MKPISALDPTWMVTLINEYARQPREAANEADLPYPDLAKLASAPAYSPRRSDLITIAETLWPVFAGSDDERARLLNVLLAQSALNPAVNEDGQLIWMTGHRSARDLLLARACLTLLETVDSEGWSRLGVCAATDCQDVYIDIAGRRARRYCSSICLNRSRVRDFRSRAIRNQRRQLKRR